MATSGVDGVLRGAEGFCGDADREFGDGQEPIGHDSARGRGARIEALYDTLVQNGTEFPVRFEPMLPKVYEIMLPSLDAKLNFMNVGQRHAAFLRHVYGTCTGCAHADILKRKKLLLTAILSKLLDINGILEQKDDRS